MEIKKRVIVRPDIYLFEWRWWGKLFNRGLRWGHPALLGPGGEILKYTRFERARIIGARALQITLGAPVLIKVLKDMIDPINIAIMEYDRKVIPITVQRDRTRG